MELLRKVRTWRQLLIALLVQQMAFYGMPVYANPVAQIVTDGRTATQLDVQGKTTEVTTSTVRGSNAYNSFSKFDVYTGNTVNLQVPGAADNLLNLVHNKRSNIDGVLNAYKNGQIGGNVFFANPHGIVVGSDGVVNVGSLSMMTPTQTFMQGFFDAAGNPAGLATRQVIEGTVPINGSALLAVQGQINALGDIRLSGGEVIVAGSLAIGSNALPNIPVSAEAIVQLAGLDQAVGMIERNGDIVILGAGDVAITGALNATGAEGIDAGNIDVRAGNDIVVSEDASLSARGEGENSGGGDVVVLADRDASIRDSASLDVSAGSSGDAGFVEFSALETVTLSGGELLASAEDGVAGTILIDPENLLIEDHLLRGDSTNADGITWDSGSLVLDADEKITLQANKVISSRSVDSPDVVENHRTGLSTADSGNITLQAAEIELQSGSEILAFADNDKVSGNVRLSATDTAGFLGGGAKATITANGAVIKAGAIELSAQATGNDTLGIAVVGDVQSSIAVDSGSVLIADTGDVTIAASSSMVAKAEGTPTDLAVDAAIVTVNSSSTVDIADAVITAQGSIDVDANSTINTQAIAKASSTSGDTNGDAAVAITDITSVASVAVADGAALTAKQNASFAASSAIDATTTADGEAGGATAAGATVAVSSVAATTSASLNDTVAVNVAGTTEVAATSSETITTNTSSTAGGASSNTDATQAQLQEDGRKAETSEGQVSVAGTLAITDLVSNTDALLATNATETVKTTELDIVASSNRTVETAADASATEGATGVGVAVAIGVANVSTRAEVRGAPSLDVDELYVQALTNGQKSSFTTTSNSGAGATNVGVAGSLASSVVINRSEAVVADGLLVNMGVAGGDITLKAESNSATTVSAKSTQEGEASVGVGASVAVNVGVNTTTAELGDGSELSGAGDVALSATSKHVAKTESEAGAAGGVAVTPVAGVTVAVNTTTARVGTGSLLDQSGELSALASHEGSSTTKTSADAAGDSVGVGASLATTVATDTVTAYTDRDIKAGGDVRFEASSDVTSDTIAKASAKGAKAAKDDGKPEDGDKDVNEQIQGQVAFGDSKSGETTENADDADASTSEGGVSVAAAISANIGTATTVASIAADRSVESGGTVTVRSSNAAAVGATADGTQVSGGDTAVGVGAAVAVNVGVVTNVASIEDGATVTADGVTVEALMVKDADDKTKTSVFRADATSGAGASGVGVAGALGTHVGVATTAALIKDAVVTLTNDGAVLLAAQNNSDSTVSAKSTQEGEASVGVGASVAVNVGVTTTTAEIGDDATLTDGGSVTLSSSSEHNASTSAEAGSAGGIAVSPVAAVTVAINDTKARLGDGDDLNLSGDLSITAESKAEVTNAATAAAGGDIGVGISISVAVPVNETTATLARGGSVEGSLDIDAASALEVLTTADASATGASDKEEENGGTVNELTSKWTSFATPDDKEGDVPDAPKAEVDNADELTASTGDAGATEKPAGGGGGGGGGEKEKTEVKVAGAVGVNVALNDVTANIADNVHLSQVGNTKVTSSNDVNIKTKASGTAVSSDYGVGAAIALTVQDNDSTAEIGEGVVIDQAGDITVESKTTNNTGEDFVSKVGTEAIAGASGGKVAVAGSVAVVNSTNSSRASIEKSANIAKSGAVIVNAEDKSKVTARAWSGALSKGEDSKAGVGASFAILNVGDETHAYIGESASLSDAGAVSVTAESKEVDSDDFSFNFDFVENKLKSATGKKTEDGEDADFEYDDINPLNILSANNYYTEAAAGAASTGDSGVAVAGAFSVQVLHGSTKAYIDKNAEVVSDDKVTVSAKRNTNAVALGGSFGGSKKVGVGVTISNINALDETIAFIGDGASVSSNAVPGSPEDEPTVSVQAYTEQLLSTIGLSGAVAAGGGEGVAINGVLGAVVSVKNTAASIGDGATVSSQGSVAVDAQSDTDTIMIAGGIAVGGNAGVGASAAAHVAVDRTTASIGKDAQVDAKKDTTVSAVNDDLAINGVISGGGGGKVGVILTGSANIILGTTEASIGEGARINTDATYDDPAQNVTVKAQDDTLVVDVAGAVAGGGKAGVGAALDTIVFVKDVHATIDSGAEVEAQNDIKVIADAKETATSVTAAFAGGGNAGVSGAVSVVVNSSDVSAVIADDVHNDATNKATEVHAGGDVIVDADEAYLGVMIAGSGAGGGTAGVGGSVAVSTLVNSTKAQIGDNAVVSAGDNVKVTADGKEFVTTAVISGAGGGTAGVAGMLSTNVLVTHTEASIGEGADVDAGTDVDVTASDDTLIIGVAAGGAGGGSAGVGAGMDVGVFVKNTSAFVDDGATVDAATGDITLDAQATDLHVSTAATGAGGGSAGVSGSISTSVMVNTTEAYTVGDAELSAGDDIAINAQNDSTTVATLGAGAGGGAAGVAGAVSVVVNTNATRAYTGAGSKLNAQDDIDVTAASKENVITTAISGAGGGAAGVAGSVGMKVLSTTTQAYVGNGTQVNQRAGFDGGAGQSLNVSADDQILMVGLAGSGAGGGAAGVGVGADVNIVRNSTTAYIGDGSNIDVGGDVTVNADSDKYVNSFAGAGAGGGAAGVAVAVSVVAVGALLDSDTQGGLTNEGENGEDVTVQGYAQQQTSGDILGDSLGDSERSAATKDIVTDATSRVSLVDPDDTTAIDLGNVQAFIGPSAHVDAGNNLDVTATDNTMAIVADFAGAGGGAAGVAGLIGVALVHNDAEAFIAGGAQTNAAGKTNVEASTREDVFMAGISGAGGGAAGVAGGAMLTVVNSDTVAYIANDTMVNLGLGNADAVVVVADSETNITNLGATGGGAGAAGVGGIADAVVIVKTTKASIEDDARVHADEDVAIEAESSEQVTSGAVAIFGGGAAAVSGVASAVVIANETEAYIGADATVDSDGNVKLSAVDDALILNLGASGAGAGAAGVTGVVNVNTVTNNTSAYIKDGATVNARGNAAGTDAYTGKLTDTASGLALPSWDRAFDVDTDNDPDTDNTIAANVDTSPNRNTEEGAGQNNIDTSNGINTNVSNGLEGDDAASTSPSIPGVGINEKETMTVTGLAVAAVSNEKVATVAASVGGAGAAAVAGAAIVTVIATETNAGIGSNATINDTRAGAGQSVSLLAADNTDLGHIGGTVTGAGAAAVSGSVNTAIVAKTTTARVANGTDILAGGSVGVDAMSTEKIDLYTANVSIAGAAGVGGAAGVAVVSNTTTAELQNETSVDASEDLGVNAVSDSDINIVTVSGSGGVVGVSGGASVAVISNDTFARVGDKSELDIGGDAVITAVSKDKANTDTVSASGGGVGVAGAVSVKVMTGETTASLGDQVMFNQGTQIDKTTQSISVEGKNTVELDGIGGSAAAGGVGVGATADINIVRNSVGALVGDGSMLQAAGDISVAAEADKNVDSFTIAAAGGAVGVGGATSITVIGAALDEDAQNSVGENNETASYADEKMTEDKTTGAMGDSVYLKDTESDIAARTSSLGVSSDMNATVSTNDRTIASVGVGATLDAGNTLAIKSTDYTTATTKTGGAAVGSVGVGGAVGVTTITNTTEAAVAEDANLSGGNMLTIAAKNTQKTDEDTRVIAFGGAAGLVGIGAAVAYVDTDNTARATTGSNVTVSDTHTVRIMAEQDDDIRTEAVGAAAGAGAVGASLSRSGRDGTVEASLGDDSSVVSNVDNVFIDADSSGLVKAKTIAGAAGTTFAASGAVAIARDDSDITAKTGNRAEVTVSDAMRLSASSTPEVDAESIGVSVAGGIKVGASVADADSSQTIKAYTGVSNIISANTLSINARHARNGASNSVRAKSVGAGGGLLVGLNATSGDAKSIINMDSYLGSGSTVSILNDLMVGADNDSRQSVYVTGVNVGGLLAAGFNEASAESNTVVLAHVDDNAVISGGNVSIAADSTDDNQAQSIAGSGGMVSGSASEADTKTSSITKAYIADGTAGKAINVEAIAIAAQHHSKFNAQVDSTNASLVGASGATASNVSDATVEAGFGDGLTVGATAVDVDAGSEVTKTSGGWTVNSGSGGLLDLPAASSTTSIRNFTTTSVGDGTEITQLGDRKNPGMFAFDAQNKVTAADKVRMNAGGAIALAKARSTISALTNHATVNIGAGSELMALGDIGMGAKADADISTTTAVDVFGLAGEPFGDAVSRFGANNSINVEAGATIVALRDLHLGAGMNSASEESNIHVAARTDLWNNSALPLLHDPVADTYVNTSNNIHVAGPAGAVAGADVAAARHLFMTATRGNTTLSGVGIGKDIYSETLAAIVNGIGGIFGAEEVSFDRHGGSEVEVSSTNVTVDGSARVGIQSRLELEIDENGDITRWINGEVTYDLDEGIRLGTAEQISLFGDIQARIDALKDLIAEYDTNGQNTEGALAVAAYEAEIEFLEHKLVELGYVAADDQGGFSGSQKTELQQKRDFIAASPEIEATYTSDKTDFEGDRTVYEQANAGLVTQNEGLQTDVDTLAGEVTVLTIARAALDPNDTDYATDYAAYTNQINTKNGEITTKNGAISTNEGIISTNNTEIVNLNGQIAGVEADLVTLEGRVTTTNAEIAAIEAAIANGTYVDKTAGPLIDVVVIEDTVAQLGNIYVKGDSFGGVGALSAPGDAEIKITNRSNNFLKLHDLIIPSTAGGKVFFNNVDVVDNAAVNAISNTNTANFNTLLTAEGSTAPNIEVTSTYDPLDASNIQRAADSLASGEYPPYANIGPDIIVVAGESVNELTHISNSRGSIKVKSAGGNIRLEENTLVSGATVEIKTRNGDFIQSYTDAFSHIVGGEPLTFTDADSASNTLANISKNTAEGSGSGIVANGSVLLAARYLNINGTVQSGIPEWGVVISEGAQVDVPTVPGLQTFTQARDYYAALTDAQKAEPGAEYFHVTGASVTGLDAAASGEWEQISVEYNAKDDRLELGGVEVKGGYIQIFGQVFNTNGNAVAGEGRLRVLDGYGEIQVDNRTTKALYLNALDAGQGVEGKISITNVEGLNADGSPKLNTTIFTRNGADRSQQLMFDPDAYLGSGHLQYSMTKGTDVGEQKTYLYHNNSWFNVDALGTAQILASTLINYRNLSDDPLSKGEYLKVAGTASYNTQGIETKSDTELLSLSVAEGRSWADCNWWTLCANADHYQEFIVTTGSKTVDTYNINAGNPISIEYIGHDNGIVNIASSGDVLIAGGVYNRNGDTSITSRDGSIQQITDFATVQGNSIGFAAATGIGSMEQAIDVVGLQDTFSAITQMGDINIHQATGDMDVVKVATGSGRVLLNVDGNINGTGVGAGFGADIKGDRVALISRNGGIGTERTLNIETGYTTDLLKLADTGLEALARNSIDIENHASAGNEDGHLMVVSVESLAGDVSLKTPGAIIDNNQVERTDTRAIDELVALWDDIGLRGDSADAKDIREIEILEDSVTAEYRRYWETRGEQAGIAITDDAFKVLDAEGNLTSEINYAAYKNALNSSSYDSKYQVALSTDQENVLRDQLALRDNDRNGVPNTPDEVDALVQGYIDERTSEYHAQHARLYDPSSDNAVQGNVASIFEDDFRYEAAESEIDNRTEGSHWSDFQLAVTLSSSLLKELTDTVAVVEEPNVIGRNVTLEAGQDIGNVRPVLVDLSRNDALDFTVEEKAALAAAERGDVDVYTDYLTINQRDDVDVGQLDGGSVSAVAAGENGSDGDVYLGSEGDLALDRIVAANEIRVKVAGGLINGNSSIGTLFENIVGKRTILEAAHGAIGSVDKAMILRLEEGAPVTARARDDIYLTNVDGDFYIDTLYSRSNITLESNDSIVDAFSDDALNVRAENITLTAGNAVGADDNALDVLNSAEGEVVATSNTGGIYLRVPNSTGNFGRIDSADEVSLAAAYGYRISDAVTGLANISLLADGEAIITSTGSVTGQLGDLQVTGTALRVEDGGWMNAGLGRLVMDLDGDAIVTGLYSGYAGPGAIDIRTGGRVLDGGDTRTDITALADNSSVSIRAGGVGNASVTEDGIVDTPNALEVDVLRVEQITAVNDIHVSSATGLTAGSIESLQGGVDVRVTGGNAAVESLLAQYDILLEVTGEQGGYTGDVIESREGGVKATIDGDILVDRVLAKTHVELESKSGDVGLRDVTGNSVSLASLRQGGHVTVEELAVAQSLALKADHSRVASLTHTEPTGVLRLTSVGNNGGMGDTLSMFASQNGKVLADDVAVDRMNLELSGNQIKFRGVQVGSKAEIKTPLHSVVIDNTEPRIYPETTLQVSGKGPLDLELFADRRATTTGRVIFYDPEYIINSYSGSNSLDRVVANNLKVPEATNEILQRNISLLQSYMLKDDALAHRQRSTLELINYNEDNLVNLGE
ncbi:leukotoxin LktA family filamentous adhesin [Halieaceae bacterium IMCC14734]|uniref:Leukotoxin LktA family filamentous adhesin n=1 Tax=Candidatus Litorirhabdus singularis TaxID=2518993 RepID=A0ABT3TM57_9GAMM|nr:leukotoxin LktA family filamentous adhesin [Candidatus Litorirhabdus singularis]MCX2983413.1 leukotoxin LktA family filamentous adhesin [Candidatus Litorirhabdus singularis]